MPEESTNQELNTEDLKNVAGGTRPPVQNTKKAVREGHYRAGDEYLSKEERIANRGEHDHPDGEQTRYDPNA